MLPPDEEKKLEQFLALTPNPDDTFSYDELLGFLFGLAITPESVPPGEWISCIFGGEEPAFKSAKQAEEMTDCLIRVYNRLGDAFHDHALDFPIDITNLVDEKLFTIYEWVSGFDEALTLRAPLWEPEFFPKLNKAKKEELFFSLMIIEGLVEPDQVMDFFEKLPEEFLRESFPDMDAETMDQDMQIQIFLLASLPLAVRTLQNHARTIVNKKQGSNKPIPLQRTRANRPEPSPCGGCGSEGQPGSCCGTGAGRKGKAVPAGTKKSNVIKVDFPQHGKPKKR